MNELIASKIAIAIVDSLKSASILSPSFKPETLHSVSLPTSIVQTFAHVPPVALAEAATTLEASTLSLTLLIADPTSQAYDSTILDDVKFALKRFENALPRT